MTTMDWKPATIEIVREFIESDLPNCSAEQLLAFEKYRVTPHYSPIIRQSGVEQVVVIARKEDEVMYWNDIEEGFGVSPIGAGGILTKEDSNQNDLGVALNAWI